MLNSSGNGLPHLTTYSSFGSALRIITTLVLEGHRWAVLLGRRRYVWAAHLRYVAFDDSDISLSGLTWTVPPQTFIYPSHIRTTVALRSRGVYASSTVAPKDMGHLFTSRTYLTILLIRHGPRPRYQNPCSHLLRMASLSIATSKLPSLVTAALQSYPYTLRGTPISSKLPVVSSAEPPKLAPHRFYICTSKRFLWRRSVPHSGKQHSSALGYVATQCAISFVRRSSLYSKIAP